MKDYIVTWHVDIEMDGIESVHNTYEGAEKRMWNCIDLKKKGHKDHRCHSGYIVEDHEVEKWPVTWSRIKSISIE